MLTIIIAIISILIIVVFVVYYVDSQITKTALIVENALFNTNDKIDTAILEIRQKLEKVEYDRNCTGYDVKHLESRVNALETKV